MLNVLITSASRKVSLVRAFQTALRREGGGAVVACDASAHAAALYVADRGHRVRRLEAPDFEDRLMALCAEEEIGLLVPTRDGELPWFAARRERLRDAGVRVLAPTPEVVERCADKLAFVRFCRRAGFAVPATFEPPLPAPTELPYPLFVRPRRGKGSGGAGPVTTPAALATRLAEDGDLLVQEVIEAPELTIDLAADFEGRVLSVVPRLRLVTFGGESFVGRTVDDPEVVTAAAGLARELGLVGHNTLQCFRDRGAVRFIEVNPRYGGGAALGIAAGADTPRMMVRLALGRPVDPMSGYEVGLTMLRHTEDLLLPADQLLSEGASR